MDRRGHPRLGTTGREARRVTVSCPDSAEKVVRQLAALATVPVTYNGKPLPGPPREIRIGPQFWRRFACAAGCAACCLPFSLDLLPSERAALPPEFQRHFRERTVTVNGRRVTLATVADNWRDGRCLFLVPGRGGDLRVLGCALYPTMPLSCQSAPQFQPIYRRDEQVTYLMKRPFSRAWNFPEPPQCRFEGGYDPHDDLALIARFRAWAEELAIPTVLDAVERVVARGPYRETVTIPVAPARRWRGAPVTRERRGREEGQRVEVVRIPVEEIKPAPYNPRRPLQPGDPMYEALARSLDEFGLVEPLVWNRRTGHLVGGHQRLRVLLERGVKEVDVSVVDLPLEKEKALNVALNKIQGEWDEEILAMLLRELEATGQLDLTGFTRAELDELEAELERAALEDIPLPSPSQGRERREYPVDLIYTFGGRDTSCCQAVKLGFLYGFQSSKRPCLYAERMQGHEVQFIDNDYFRYDHARHLEAVARYRPKYATVRDVMTKEQCEAAGIAYYDLDTILRWAEEIGEYAEHVIVIPKYDCLDEIPERYILGYSIPTSHGGTPLPIERFFGRRIHLLGGSPRDQFRYYKMAEPYVVSIDHNYVHKLSQYGQVWNLTGSHTDVRDLVGGEVASFYFIAMSINLAKLAWLFGRKPQDDIVELDGTPGDEPSHGDVLDEEVTSVA